MKEAEIYETISPQAAKVSSTPIVLGLKRSKKRKGRYSRGLKDLQVAERQTTRSVHRMVRATDKGMASYRKRRNKSARSKRDGAVRDFILNSGWGMSRAFREASPLPYEFAQALAPRGARRLFASQVRIASRGWRALRRA